MAQLILIIWKFLRNYIHKQLQQNRSSQEKEETVRQNRHSRVAKRSRRGEQVENISENSEDEDKENQGYLRCLIFIFFFNDHLLFIRYRWIHRR